MHFATVDIGYKTFSVCFWDDARPVEFVHKCLVESKYNQSRVTLALHDTLTQHEPLLKACKVVIIEGQLALNRKADRISAQLQMWLVGACPDTKIRLMAPRQKYTLPSPPPPPDKAGRKKWAANVALDYLASTSPVLANRLSLLHKKDDVGDCIVMGLVFLAKTGNKNTKKKCNK